MKLDKEDVDEKVEEKLEPMPMPSPLKISTITLCFNLKTTINLNVLSRYLKVYDIDSPEVLSNDGQVIYAKQIYTLPRGWTDKKPKKKKNSETSEANTRFPNQLTITFRYCGVQCVSAMIFGNGAIKLAGCLSYAEGKWVANRLQEIILNTKVKIYHHFNELPTMGNQLYDFNIVVNKGGLVRSYRWCQNNNCYNWEPTDIMTDEYVENIGKGLVMNHIWHDIDTNFLKLANVNKIKDLINNNKLQTDYLTDIMPNTVDVITSRNPFDIQPVICMINSDFNFFFHMKCDILRDILTNQYKLDASYGQNGYNTVKCQYKWNKNNRHSGICKCSEICYKKTKTNRNSNECKSITVTIYQNGNTIITGAITFQQLKDTHQFITQLVSDNYQYLYKNEPYYSKKALSGRTNIKNKKRKIVALKKDKINNVHQTIPKIDLSYLDKDEDDV